MTERYARLTRSMAFDVHDSEWEVRVCQPGEIVVVALNISGRMCVWPRGQPRCSRPLSIVADVADALTYLSPLEMLALQAE